MSEAYDGFTNYETWSINLIGLNDTSEIQNIWRNRARHAWTYHEPNPYWSSSEAARFMLADELKEHFERLVERYYGNSKGSMYRLFSQLLTSALSEVNWDELADDLLITTIGDEYHPAEYKHAK